MHYMHWTADDNARKAQKLYEERFSTRHVPHESTFQLLPSLKDDILIHIGDHLVSSTQILARIVVVFHNTVWRVLRDKRMHPYRALKIQNLEPSPLPDTCVNFTIVVYLLSPHFVPQYVSNSVFFGDLWLSNCVLLLYICIMNLNTYCIYCGIGSVGRLLHM